MLLGALLARLLGNMLADNGVIRVVDELHIAGQDF